MWRWSSVGRPIKLCFEGRGGVSGSGSCSCWDMMI